MSEYIINSNNIFIGLKDNIESFNNEAMIIEKIKCHLINYHDLDDFEYEDCYINETYDGYEVYYEDLNISLEVDDGIIINYQIM